MNNEEIRIKRHETFYVGKERRKSNRIHGTKWPAKQVKVPEGYSWLCSAMDLQRILEFEEEVN